MSTPVIVAGPASRALAADAAAGQRSPRELALVGQSRIENLLWTHRSGCERILRGVTREQWSDPARAGWTCVKSNPGRDVWQAAIAGRQYFLKYYFPTHWLRRIRAIYWDAPCASEWRGGIYSLKHGIPAVVPVGYTADASRNGRRCAILVTEALLPAYPLQDFWRQVSEEPDRARRRADATQVLERLAELIARAHQAGFQHTDMHAANILVQPTAPGQFRCAFVDLHSARIEVAVSDESVVANLAQLNQWFRRNSPVADRIRFLRAYFRWRNQLEPMAPLGRPLGLRFEELVHGLANAAERHAAGLYAQRDRRGQRTGRYFAKVTLDGGWRGNVFLRSKHPSSHSRASQFVFDAAWWKSQWPKLAAALGDDATAGGKESHSGRVTRAVLDHPQGPLPVILKAPRARNWVRALRSLLGESRSRRAWKIGNALLHRDVPTARPLMVVERRVGPWVRESALITEAIPGARDLEATIRDAYAAKPSSRRWRESKRAWIDALVRAMRQLEDRRVVHRDCKANNILIVDHPTPRVVWIDMDGIRLTRRAVSRHEVRRALARLHVSLLRVPGLTRTDRARFLIDYFSRFGASRRAWREEWRAIEPLVADKARRAGARREWKLKNYGRE